MNSWAKSKESKFPDLAAVPDKLSHGTVKQEARIFVSNERLFYVFHDVVVKINPNMFSL